MSKEMLRKRINEMVDIIEDQAVLNVLLEDAAVYTKRDTNRDDDLTPEQWGIIEQARDQIKVGQFKTYAEIKEHFAHFFSFYKTVDAIAYNPCIGRKTSKNPAIRKILITKHNLFYYKISDTRIELLTIFFTAQNPRANKFG